MQKIMCAAVVCTKLRMYNMQNGKLNTKRMCGAMAYC